MSRRYDIMNSAKIFGLTCVCGLQPVAFHRHWMLLQQSASDLRLVDWGQYHRPNRGDQDTGWILCLCLLELTNNFVAFFSGCLTSEPDSYGFVFWFSHACSLQQSIPLQGGRGGKDNQLLICAIQKSTIQLTDSVSLDRPIIGVAGRSVRHPAEWPHADHNTLCPWPIRKYLILRLKEVQRNDRPCQEGRSKHSSLRTRCMTFCNSACSRCVGQTITYITELTLMTIAVTASKLIPIKKFIGGSQVEDRKQIYRTINYRCAAETKK